MNDILQDLQSSHPGEDPLMDRAKEEIMRLRYRIEDLLRANNNFEEWLREARRDRNETNKKYQNLRRLVLIEAAEHCENKPNFLVHPKDLGIELRMKARGCC